MHYSYINDHLKSYALMSTMFNLFNSSMNQTLFEKHLCNQSGYYEKYKQFTLWKKVIMCNRQISTFCSQQRWRRRTLVSPWKCIVCTELVAPWGQTVKKIKPIALSYTCMKLSISQSVSQLVSQSEEILLWKNSVVTFEGILGRYESLFGLSFTCPVIVWQLVFGRS